VAKAVQVAIRKPDEMRRRGFINGQNLTIDCHEFGPNVELSSEYAGELVKAKVDVIIAWGDVAIRASQRATKAIPILAMTDDMLDSGLVNSLVDNGCAASRTAGGGARTQYRAFNSSDRQSRGRRSGHRHSEDIGRHGA
jgi:hypothetical protein